MFAKSKNLLNDFAIINDSYDDNLKISFLSKLNEVKFFFLSLPLLTLDKDRIFSILLKILSFSCFFITLPKISPKR